MSMPEKITARGSEYLQKDITDINLSLLEYKNGKAAHIFVSWLNPFKK